MPPTLLAVPLALALAATATATAAPAASLRSSLLFGLSTWTGHAESTWASLTYDRRHDEVFVVHMGTVDVFNHAGMRTHSFGGDGDFTMVSVAALEGGDLVVVGSYDDHRRAILRCDFRGEPVRPFEITGLPPGSAKLAPDTVVHHQGRLYFADRPAMRVVVTEDSGAFVRGYDLAALLELDAKSREGGMSGFGVAEDGSLLLTLPASFAAFVVSPSGVVRGFGTRGSTPGKFNIVGGITTDEHGNLFLTDRLRSVVMAFDRDLAFRGEFGYRGDEEDNLVAPFDIAAGNGKVIVSQAGNRGVSVFKYWFE